MTAAFTALLPVFLVILLGAALRRTKLIDEKHWLAVDQLCYLVLFPALIFKEIAAADFANLPVWTMAFTMIAAITSMFIILLVSKTPICSALKMQGAQFASLFQGATRWHTFIALAIIPVMFGPKALALGAVSAAAMTPLLNVVNVWVHAAYVGDGRVDAKAIALSIAKNPFVLSSLGGVLWQLLGLPLPWPFYEVLDITGKGALGLALLAVGAGLQFDVLREAKWPVAAAVVLKLLVMPLLMFIWIKLLGLSGDAALVALLCGAVPTGSGAYVLARQMGGDAPMVANILTAQVILAALTIPLVLTLAG